MSIYSTSGAKGLQRSVCLKAYYLQKYEFTLGLHTAKNIQYVKKASNKGCSELNFMQKSMLAHLSLPHEWSLGLQSLLH